MELPTYANVHGRYKIVVIRGPVSTRELLFVRVDAHLTAEMCAIAERSTLFPQALACLLFRVMLPSSGLWSLLPTLCYSAQLIPPKPSLPRSHASHLFCPRVYDIVTGRNLSTDALLRSLLYQFFVASIGLDEG